MLNRTLILLSASLYILSSCGSPKKTTATIEAPSPIVERTLPPLPESRINIPVKVAMRPLIEKMEAVTAKQFTSDKWPDYYQSSCDFRYKYRFLRSPFTFSCVNNVVNIGFQGHYQIAGSKTVCAFNKQLSPWISGSCGFGNEPLRKVDLAITSILEMLPRHQLRTTTRLSKLNAVDKCQVSLLQTDVTAEVMDSIRVSVESYCTTFDQLVQGINDFTVLDKWRRSSSPVLPVMKYGFLNLNPTYFRIGKFNYNRDTLYFSVGFHGNPAFASDSHALATSTPLPPLISMDQPAGIATYLHAAYEYTFLSSLLNDSLRNKPFEVDGKTFVIRNVQLSGTTDNKIQVEVAFDGYKKGTLRLNGTPLLDTATQVLSMPDISFSLDSRDMLLNIAKGLFRKKIMKQLKDQSVFDIGALIEKHKESIAARLNQPVNTWLQTKGDLQSLRIIGLLPRKDVIELQVFLQGSLTLIGAPPAGMLAF
jgi:hypothetical protein